MAPTYADRTRLGSRHARPVDAPAHPLAEALWRHGPGAGDDLPVASPTVDRDATYRGRGSAS